jgi:hypothetical protein
MVGDERVRFSGHCSKHVCNLAEMTADEAGDLITKTEGKSVCARVTGRRAGPLTAGSRGGGAREGRRRSTRRRSRRSTAT